MKKKKREIKKLILRKHKTTINIHPNLKNAKKKIKNKKNDWSEKYDLEWKMRHIVSMNEAKNEREKF